MMRAFNLDLMVLSFVALHTSCGSDSIGKIGGTAGGSGASTGGAAGSAGNGTAGAGGQSIPDGGGAGGEITKVAPTTGCGKAAPATGRATIMTMGTKPNGCADSKCGAWSYEREYFLNLPANYGNTNAYPLVFEGPGCGGSGLDVYPLNNNVDGTVIRVGLTPPPNAIGHATNPNQGCFDDKEGDDSVDWIFYENLWDKLADELCFDKNRVFASGNSSGAWIANEVGCKYAGDAVHPIRAIMPNTGGLPDQTQYRPTCTTQPMAGMWVHEVNDQTIPFTGNQYAITRAMQVNGCPGGNYAGATWDDFPIGGGNADATCRKMRGCPELYPLVVCPLVGNAQSAHDSVTNPGFSTFIKMFSAGALITP
jgi:poly(3-hydroxybutyrate) depolymerase